MWLSAAPGAMLRVTRCRTWGDAGPGAMPNLGRCCAPSALPLSGPLRRLLPFLGRVGGATLPRHTYGPRPPCRCLESRLPVDELISADPDQLATVGIKQLAARVRNAAYALEPEVFTARREIAVGERHVSLRPAADGMTLPSALVPLKHGVAIPNTLTRVADTAKAGGDDRGRGQLTADAPSIDSPATHPVTRAPAPSATPAACFPGRRRTRTRRHALPATAGAPRSPNHSSCSSSS